MVRKKCQIHLANYNSKCLLKLQRRFFPEIQLWRRTNALNHKCDSQGCWCQLDHLDEIYDEACGDGICHLTTYVLHEID